MMFYFIIMKYNLTNETYLPQAITHFPAAPEMTFGNMISSALYYNIFPLSVSFITYYFIIYLSGKLFRKISNASLLITGLILTMTTPLIYFASVSWRHNDFYLKNAEIISWGLCGILSVAVYYLFNKSSITGRYAHESIL